MSRFNRSKKMSNVIKNHEGHKAYKMIPELELYNLVVTMSMSNKFYESLNEQMTRLRNLISIVSPKFVAKLAVYTRKEMYMRSVPLVLTVELAKIHKGDGLISKMVQGVVQRADEITELLAYYQQANDREGIKKLNKLSNQIKKGIKSVFESGRFNEYHFGKYNRKTDVKFRDALFLTHPKPADNEMKELFDKIVSDTLDVPYTWETQLSEAGKADSPVTTKKAVWEELIDSKKVGYMALLRNLRNILNAGVSQEHIKKVCDYISNPVAVKNSKQFPFRFLSAYRMLGNYPTRGYWNGYGNSITESVTSPWIGMVLDALEDAMIHSSSNINGFDDDFVLIATDVSASMQQPVSPKSVITQYDIGAVLSMMMYRACKESICGIFGDRWEVMNFPKNQILRNANKIWEIEGKVGYSTNGYKVLQWANRKNFHFDKVMVFTDCQLYGGDIISEWNTFKQNNPNAKLYLFNLNGYNSVPLDVKNNDIYLISGWSDRIFDVIVSLDKGRDALDMISSIEL